MTKKVNKSELIRGAIAKYPKAKAPEVLAHLKKVGVAVSLPFAKCHIEMIFLFPLAFVVSSEWIYGTLIGTMWLLVPFLPLYFGEKSPHPRFYVQTVLVCQSLSFA